MDYRADLASFLKSCISYQRTSLWVRARPWLAGTCLAVGLLLSAGAYAAGGGVPPAMAPAGAAPVRATVTSVQDGDSLTVKLPGGGATQRVRLVGIDAPELRQPMGHASRESLRSLALRREVALTCNKQDRYARWVCRAHLSANGTDLSREQLLRGMAWQDRRRQGELPAPMRAADERAEAQARRAGRGVFSQPDPVPPWQWRRAHR